jgi:hypothetical protein
MTQKLSTSAVFKALQDRVQSLEQISPLPSTLGNAVYLSGKRQDGVTTRLFGVNAANALYIGGIDAGLSGIVMEVAQTPVVTYTLSATTFTSPIIVQDAPSNGSCLINVGNATVTGQILFRTGDSVSRASIGSATSSGPLLFNSSNGGGHSFLISGSSNFLNVLSTNTVIGGTTVLNNDYNFTLSRPSTNPRLTVDLNDYYEYDRSNNVHSFIIAGSAPLQVSGSAVGFCSDANLTISKSSSNPRVTLDTGDYIEYDRTANKFYFAIAGVTVTSIDASGNMRLKGTLTQSVTP